MTDSAPSKIFAVPELVWDVAELESRLGERGLKVVDVRVGELYATGHIPGATHFSVYGVNIYDSDEAPLKSFTQMWAFLLGIARDYRGRHHRRLR